MKISQAQKRQRHRHGLDVRQSRGKMAGLGLLEVMLFLFVVGTLLVVGYTWLAAKKQSERAEAQTAQLQYVNRYVESFAAVNFRLPCPATTAGGAEDCTVATNVKGFLPLASIGLDATDARVGGSNMLYMVSRSALADLGVATNAFEPANLKNTAAVPDTFDFKQISTGDYCRNLALASGETAGVKVFNGATGRRVAYAIAHPGQLNADGTGSNFDGRNEALNNSAMEAPETAQNTSGYDDAVLARTPNELMFSTDCVGHIASLNLMGIGVNVISEVKSQFEDAKKAAELEILVSIFKTLIAAYGVGMAGLSLGTSIAELAVYASALAAAIVSCIVLVGCPLIPPYTAAVTAQSIAIGLNVAGVVLAAAAVVINIVYIGLVAEVAVLAGSAATQANPDLTAIVAAALARRNAATLEKTAAAARIVTAQNNLTAADPPRVAAQNQLYTTTRDTISIANVLGLPVTTTPNTTNDSYATDVVAKFTALTQAKDATATANQAVLSAQQAASSPQTAAQIADIANKQTLAANAATAQATAQTNYTNARNALITVNKRQYCQTTANPFPPPATVTNCFFYDQQATITGQITTYEQKYTAYAVAFAGVTSAQDAYNKAVLAETGAIDTYNQLAAINTNTGTPGGSALTPWPGAEAILKLADDKGGIR